MTEIAQKYNLLLLGSTEVGKTCFLQKVKNGIFIEKYDPTNKIEKCVINVKNENGENIEFSITEIAGQQRFGKFDPSNFYEGTDCMIVLFDFTAMISFELINIYCDNVYNFLGKKIPTIICGNKNDIQLRLGSKNKFLKGINFLEISAKKDDYQTLIQPFLILSEQIKSQNK